MTGWVTSRIGLAAVAAAICAIAATSALGASGGVGSPGSGGGGSSGGGGKGCLKTPFGKRNLERGDCGGDVTTLNWLLKARDYGVPLKPEFGGPTHQSVRDLQHRKDIASTGVVNGRTRDRLVRGMKGHLASWYGPGFFGNRTACGQTLRRDTKGVAHRSLPCGARVVVRYGGRFVRTRVIDRGPYVKRRYERDWDLTQAVAERLRFEGVNRIRTATIR